MNPSPVSLSGRGMISDVTKVRRALLYAVFWPRGWGTTYGLCSSHWFLTNVCYTFDKFRKHFTLHCHVRCPNEKPFLLKPWRFSVHRRVGLVSCGYASHKVLQTTIEITYSILSVVSYSVFLKLVSLISRINKHMFPNTESNSRGPIMIGVRRCLTSSLPFFLGTTRGKRHFGFCGMMWWTIVCNRGLIIYPYYQTLVW